MKNLTNDTGDIKTLQDWNNVLVLNLMPFTVALVIYVLLGILGNITVLYIYFVRFKSYSEGRYFIVILAVTDLVACIVNCACHLSETMLPVMYFSDIGCKIERYLCMITTAPSIFILLLIVVERYMKICTPFGKQMSMKHKIVSTVIIYVVVLIISLPCFAFFGSMEIKSKDGTLVGRRCVAVSGGLPILAVAFNVSLFIIAAVVLIVMAVLYSLIGKVIFKKVNFSIKDKSKPKSADDTISTEMFSTQSPNIDKSIVSTDVSTITTSSLDGKTTAVNLNSHDVSTITTNSFDGKTTAVNLNTHKRDKSIHHWRITLVFIIVTITFAISFIPKLTMMVIESVNSSFWLNMSED